MVSFPSSIAVDLSQPGTLQALASLQDLPDRARKVKTARIYLSRPSMGIHHSLSQQDVVQIFGILATLPNMKQVQINLSRTDVELRPNMATRQWHGGAVTSIASMSVAASASASISLEAFASLLAGSRLKSLHLQNVRVVFAHAANAVEELQSTMLEGLVEAAQGQNRLQEVSVIDCTGIGMGLLISALTTHCPCLDSLQIKGAPLGSAFNAMKSEALQSLRHRLHSLVLEDILDMNDHTLVALAGPQFLSHPKCHLKYLSIRSSTVTNEQRVGETLAYMLANNRSLQHVTLHVDCERLGVALAEKYFSNYHSTSRLKSLDLRCYGDDVDVLQDALDIAKALSTEINDWAKKSAGLEHLHLRLEMTPYFVEEHSTESPTSRWVSPIMSHQDIVGHSFLLGAFDEMVQNNESLQTLVLDDGGNQRYQLSAETNLKLKINQCGYSATSDGPSPNHLLEALVAGKDNTEVSFYILSQHPDIIVDAACYDNTTKEKDTRQTIPPQETDSTAVGKKSLRSTSMWKRMPGRTTRRSLRRRVLSVFAPSA